jgi:hypothetical protein
MSIFNRAATASVVPKSVSGRLSVIIPIFMTLPSRFLQMGACGG